MSENKSPVVANGRNYAWPKAPLVVICCDGSEPAYMDQAMADGLMIQKQAIAMARMTVPRLVC